MSIVTFVKRLFRKTKKYEVWDTSAISNHFEKFKEALRKADDKIIVVPEGVSHEISCGRKHNDICKEIYKFIEGNLRNPKLVIEVTPNSIRSWEVDEQVIYIAESYTKRGFDVKFVTCDRDQSLRARLKKLNTELLPVVKVKNVLPNVQKSVEHAPRVVPVNEKNNFFFGDDDNKEEFELPTKKLGKQCVVNASKFISVYDPKGKRKIPKDGAVLVTRDDLIYYKDRPYTIKTINNASLSLVRLR